MRKAAPGVQRVGGTVTIDARIQPTNASETGSASFPLHGAIRFCVQRRHLRRTVAIETVVGIVLTGINQGDLLVEGHFSATLAIKLPLNFLVPFVVSNLGLLASRAD